MNNFIKIYCPIFCLYLGFGLYLSACSNDKIVGDSSGSTTQSTKAKLHNQKKHKHDANPCTAGVEHSHINGDQEHGHRYDCEDSNEYLVNAHVHPASDGYQRTKHVHPNGSNKHTHRR